MGQKPLKHYLLLPYYTLQLLGIILLLLFTGDKDENEDEEIDHDER